MVSKLDSQTIPGEFEAHWVSPSFGLELYRNKKFGKLQLSLYKICFRIEYSTKVDLPLTKEAKSNQEWEKYLSYFAAFWGKVMINFLNSPFLKLIEGKSLFCFLKGLEIYILFFKRLRNLYQSRANSMRFISVVGKQWVIFISVMGKQRKRFISAIGKQGVRFISVMGKQCQRFISVLGKQWKRFILIMGKQWKRFISVMGKQWEWFISVMSKQRERDLYQWWANSERDLYQSWANSTRYLYQSRANS